MLASALRAGVALATGLRHVVEQSSAPLAQEFGLMLREQRMGVPWDAALENLHARMPADSTSLVVAAMRIAAQTGGNLAEALESIAQTLRAQPGSLVRCLCCCWRCWTGWSRKSWGCYGIRRWGGACWPSWRCWKPPG
ncbi:hypothetical protein G6F22_018634 [Rhizopus arrhizus]|nr:hypothetical protein G6F22_018634 [Rhizopus arrhizus]